MHTMTLKQLINGLQSRAFSSAELTQHYLERIKKMGDLNAFIHVDEASALAAAIAADNARHKGETSALSGIPMAHKDLFCTRTMPTTCASKMLASYQSPYDATVVERFAAEGAILLGKTNMDEFAMGSSNENSYFGAVKNPWNTDYVPGGSSGGSAAAVSASMVPFATGSDTGGSIRQPAAFCGISGLKPTYGLVSRYGMVAYASSMDQAGPMAHSVEDLAIVLQAMVGFDKNDSTSVKRPFLDYSAGLEAPLQRLRIGLPTCFFDSAVDPEIQQAIRNAIGLFENAGASIVPLELPLESLWTPCYYVTACAEASSNLSRYDGIRFGHRAANATTVDDLISRSRTEGFGEEVKRRVLTGTHVLSEGYFDAYYLQAQKVRRLIQNELKQTLQQVDVILGPTTPTCAYKLGEKPTDPIKRYLADTFTVVANLAGVPALSIPAGFNRDGLPIGMQLIGQLFSEMALLKLGHFFQQQTNWHLARPLLKE